ncbi:energy transducer TonB [Chitinophaga solisilvae]|uniref:energy transducer TonB n=1 Tax=Chitinophaga solisilvae TaxID=1233460 RepID=UPI00136C7AB1|nr:energy transducer TonB [Chitinophaga solisilvae]
MPDKESHNKPVVSAELIRQYLAGELDDKAMHDLERQALDDPFLADALDGYAMHTPDQHHHLDDLTARLTERIAPRRSRVRTMYYRWAAAAAILLLLFTGGWFLVREEADRKPIAAVTQPAVPAEAPALRESTHISDTGKTSATADNPAALMDTDAAPVTLAAADKHKKGNAVARKSAEEISMSSMSKEDAETVAMKDMKAPAVTAAPAAAPAAVAKEMAYGYVKPLPDTDTHVNAMLSRKVAGTEISAVNVQESRMRARKGTAPEPMPVAGWETYQHYLAKHTKNPDNQFEGIVRISFTVNADSTLHDFKVIKGLNPACDAEAIRVVKEGPAWKPAPDGKPAIIELQVEFVKKKED